MTAFVIGTWIAVPLRIMIAGPEQLPQSFSFALGATTLWAYAEFVL